MTYASRHELRAEILAAMPRSYSPWVHLLAPTFASLLVAAAALAGLRDVEAWQIACVPLFVVALDAAEWHAHRGILHRRVKPFEAFYLRHMPVHHALFVPGDMALRGMREIRLVLLPGVAMPVLLLAAAPVAVALTLAGQRNLGLLWLVTAMLHYLVFEGLHLAYHLPEDSRLGSTRIVAFLRHHHERHHSPRLKSRWNFNVTVPLWDLVRGTVYRPHGVPRAPAVRRSH